MTATRTEYRIPPHCVERRADGHHYLRRETFAPPEGWRQPVALAGDPDMLLAAIGGGAAPGDEILCRGPAGVMTGGGGVEYEASALVQVWRLAAADPERPLESEVEFVCWADPKPGVTP